MTSEKKEAKEGATGTEERTQARLKQKGQSLAGLSVVTV